MRTYSDEVILLSKSIRRAIDDGIFSIQNGSLEYGTMGIICHFNNPANPMEFYFNKDALSLGLSVSQYIEKKGYDAIAEDIAATITKEMVPNSEFSSEALLYLTTLFERTEDETERANIQDYIDEIYKNETESE